MWNRRRFLGFSTGMAAIAVSPVAASASGDQSTQPRASIEASDFGVFANAPVDQSSAFQAMLDEASDADMSVFLPAGSYVVGGIRLPARVRLVGVPGATRILFNSENFLLSGQAGERIEFTGITFEGGRRSLSDSVRGLIDLSGVPHVAVDNCVVTGSGKYGIVLAGCGGRIERTNVATAAEAAIWATDSSGLQITGNIVRDCDNGGILVHRSAIGEDGTIVSSNRVERIHAAHGGTGPFGNGINVFRAGNVIVASNVIADCTFSAIRANSASNIQITGNNCARSGETAIYAEFSFEGAVISSNIVDGAANGISIVNFNEGGRMAVCSGNLVRNLATSGPYPADPPGFGVGITVEADTSVTGNVIESAPRYGMHIGWGPFMRNVVATGNVIRDVGEGIAVSVVEGTGTAVISDNVIDKAANGAIVGHRWTEAVTGDLASSGGSGFPNILVERNQVS
ncbi:MAG: TIGR03808 family TAT-translocated repetitive protein [Rhizobiaceae bacterium]|nr:TIGR03808 family TAT-translocated repetitive protein [Rhizobiaceae bacterium]